MRSHSQGPLWLLASVLIVAGAVSIMLTRVNPLFSFGCVLAPIGVVMGLLAVLPTDVCAIRALMSLIVMLYAMYACQMAASAAALYTEVTQSQLAASSAGRGDALTCASSDFMALTGVESAFVPCAYAPKLVMTRAVFAVIMSLGALRVCAAARLPARRCLIDIWTALGLTQPLIIAMTFAFIGLSAYHGVARTYQWYAAHALHVVGAFIITALARQTTLRVAARIWFSRRGRVLAMAAGIAALIDSEGRLNLADVQARAHASLRSISAECLTRAHLEENSHSSSLYSLSRPAAFGNIDAFISHSWRDSADVKWALLQEWRTEFVQAFKREPTLWFDKACIDPSSALDEQLSLLPLYAASCHSFVILLTPSYLSRGWCIIELFVWTHIGRLIDLRVPSLQHDVLAVADAAAAKDSSHSTRSHRRPRLSLISCVEQLARATTATTLTTSDSQGSEGGSAGAQPCRAPSVPNTAPFRTCSRGFGRTAPRARKSLDPHASATRLQALAAQIGRFDVLHASCSRQADMDLLLSVIEISYGTTAEFSRSVQVALQVGVQAALERELRLGGHRDRFLQPSLLVQEVQRPGAAATALRAMLRLHAPRRVEQLEPDPLEVPEVVAMRVEEAYDCESHELHIPGSTGSLRLAVTPP